MNIILLASAHYYGMCIIYNIHDVYLSSHLRNSTTTKKEVLKCNYIFDKFF